MLHDYDQYGETPALLFVFPGYKEYQVPLIVLPQDNRIEPSFHFLQIEQGGAVA